MVSIIAESGWKETGKSVKEMCGEGVEKEERELGRGKVEKCTYKGEWKLRLERQKEKRDEEGVRKFIQIWSGRKEKKTETYVAGRRSDN
jgi:hypothetical protein